MKSCYLMTEEEFDLLFAMATRSEWKGAQTQFKRIMIQLCQKGYVMDTGNDYVVDRIIYGIMQAAADTPDTGILQWGREMLYKNRNVWIYLQEDRHVTGGWKMRLYSGETAFVSSEEGKAFIKNCHE